MDTGLHLTETERQQTFWCARSEMASLVTAVLIDRSNIVHIHIEQWHLDKKIKTCLHQKLCVIYKFTRK